MIQPRTQNSVKYKTFLSNSKQTRNRVTQNAKVERVLTMENVVDSISDVGKQRCQNDVVTLDAIAPDGQGRYETQICRLDQSRIASELRKLLRANKD